MNLTERNDRLDRAIEHDEVKRGQWRACLLSQLAPECEAAEDWRPCPADVMPAWLAALTPWMDDRGTIEAWPGMVRRYAAVARRWHVLSDETWARLMFRACAISVREAMSHTTDAGALAACKSVAGLCDHAAYGDTPTAKEWSAAWAARAAWAAGAAKAAAAAAAGAGAAAAAARAARAAEEAAKAARAAEEAATAARAAGADRITAAILDAIEQACDRAEAT
jgi:hypothetical protein